MDMFSKAKEALKGCGDPKKRGGKKDIDSMLSKAMDVIDKYHVKEKAVEFAQKQVSKREKHQSGFVKKDEVPIVHKVKEAAEDFIAKQGLKLAANTPMKSSWKGNTGQGPSESYRNHFVKYESYQEYWDRRDSNRNNTPMHSSYTGAPPNANNGRFEHASAPYQPPYV